MRIYYCAEAEGRHHHVRTALGVDAGAWNEVSRRVRNWRKDLNDRYDIPEGRELHPCDLVAGRFQHGTSCNRGIRASWGMEVVTGGGCALSRTPPSTPAA